MKIPLTLGYDSQARKDTPLLATVFGYFAAAMAGLARHCVRSNAKHNGSEPVHWARGKSTDHGECSLRHLIDTEEIKAWLRRNPGHPDRAAVLTTLEHEYDARTWRSAADAQEFYEEFRGAPLAFNARLPAPVATAVELFPTLPSGPSEPVAAWAEPVAPPVAIPVEVPADRNAWPPVGTPDGPYPCVWRDASSDGYPWFWESANRIRGGFPSECAARSGYWLEHDTSQTPPLPPSGVEMETGYPGR